MSGETSVVRMSVSGNTAATVPAITSSRVVGAPDRVWEGATARAISAPLKAWVIVSIELGEGLVRA